MILFGGVVESQDDEDWENWWYYCEHADSDWHCTDDFGQSKEFEHSADGDEWSGSDDGEDGHDDDDGPPSPEDAMYMADSDGDGIHVSRRCLLHLTGTMKIRTRR